MMVKLQERLAQTDDLPLWSAPFGLVLLDAIRLTNGMRVLDIGSGSGFPMLEIADRLGLPGYVTGIDPVEEYCSLISAKINYREIPNASILSGMAEQLPFDDESFDLITSNNGLNNVQDQQAAFRECFRVTKPGGQLVTTMNLPHTMIEFYELFEQVLKEKGMIHEIDRMRQHIASKRKPVEFLKDLILHSGFSIKIINLDGFIYRFTTADALFRHFTIKSYFLPSWKEILPAGQEEEIFDKISAKVNELCRQNGEFTLSVPFACFDCQKPSQG